MKLPILSLIAMLFCTTIAHAQFNSFDLSKYKTADYSRRMLDFSGFINGGYEENSKDSEDAHSHTTNIYPNLKLDYSSIQNTRKIQKQTFINLEIKPNNYLSTFNRQNKITDPSQSKLTNNTYNAAFNFNSENRLYFRRNMFFEINPVGFVDVSLQNYKSENTSGNITTKFTEDKRTLYSNISLPVRFGLGRLENVEDARMAIFILEDLQKNNQLAKAISDEDILAFATKITQLRNKRHFDARKRRIYEIQALDSFIRDNGFSGAQNAVYFSGIIDNLGYANNPWRVSGNRFSIGMGPTLGYSINNHLSAEKNFIFNNGLGISILGDFEKPINLKWQRSIRLETGYRIADVKNTREEKNSPTIKETLNNEWAYLNFNWGYGFYPDSRSYHVLSLNPNIQKEWIKPKNSTSNVSTDLVYNVTLWLNGYLYLSERFNINYTLGLRYGGSNSEVMTETIKKNNFATSFNLSCSYSIF